MRRTAGSTIGLLGAVVISLAMVVGAFLLFGSDRLAHRWTGLDFPYLVWPLAAAGLLFSLSRLVLIIRTQLFPQPPSRLDGGEGDEDDASRRPLGVALALAQAMLLRSGWIALVVGFLNAVPQLPTTVSAHPDWPDLDLTLLDEYLEVFDSLAVWAAAVLVPFAIVRSVRVVWPVLGELFGFPRLRLIVLTIAYVSLYGTGALSVTFGFAGSWVLLVIALALFLPYITSVLQAAARQPMRRRFGLPLRAALLAADCGWVVLLLGIVSALPGVADTIPKDRFAAAWEEAGPYLGILDSLATWALILLIPFIILRAVGSFWLSAGAAFGFPLVRLVLLAAALVVFSENGVLTTAFGFPGAQIMLVVALALGLSYLATVLRNVARLSSRGPIGSLVSNVFLLAATLGGAVAPAMAVWVALDSLPSLTALFLDHDLTRDFGSSYLPHFSGGFEAREILAGFCFALALTVGLPNPLWSPARLHFRPLFTAVGYSAAGCLAWTVGAGLALLGHAYLLGGAMLGVGLVALGLTQLAGYGISSPNPALADSARWLSQSRMRGFLLGAAIAFYGLILRPLFYEAMWFAPLYEWLMVLAVIAFAVTKMRRRVRSDILPVETAPPGWSEWKRHQQAFESRPDPRWELMAGMRGRFVEHGEWARLWAYLMGLLFKNGASLESARAVFRPLRSCVAAPARWNPRGGEHDRNRPKREEALAESLRNAELSLSAAPTPVGRLDQAAFSEAAGPFIESGSEPEFLAALLIAIYWQSGADLDKAVNLWFPLVNLGEQSSQWYDLPWVRNRKNRRHRRHRQQMVDGALSHLYGDGSLDSLPVAILANPTSVFSNPHEDPQTAVPSGTLEVGQGVELLIEGPSNYFVRGPENVRGYVWKSGLLRQPILPGDEVKVAQ